MLTVVARAAVLALAASVAIDATTAVAQSPNPSASQIVDALKPRKTRGLSVKPTPAEIERGKLIEDLKTKAATRALSVPERTQLAEAVKDKPGVDLVIYFEFNSAEISPKSRDALAALGTALQDNALKGASILVAGHTDAKGRPEYNQSLSERRANAVKEYLSKNYNVSSDFTVVGYGAERLKMPGQPFAGENRRVQIVNLTDPRTSDASK